MGGPTRLKLVAQSHPTARVYLLSGTGCAWALVRRRVPSEITLAVGITGTSNARARDLSYSGFISHTYRAQSFKDLV